MRGQCRFVRFQQRGQRGLVRVRVVQRGDGGRDFVRVHGGTILHAPCSVVCFLRRAIEIVGRNTRRFQRRIQRFLCRVYRAGQRAQVRRVLRVQSGLLCLQRILVGFQQHREACLRGFVVQRGNRFRDFLRIDARLFGVLRTVASLPLPAVCRRGGIGRALRRLAGQTARLRLPAVAARAPAVIGQRGCTDGEHQNKNEDSNQVPLGAARLGSLRIVILHGILLLYE